MSISEASLRFELTNTYPAQPSANKGMGIGQTNVRNRLKLLYPGKGTFAVHRDAGKYNASVSIAL